MNKLKYLIFTLIVMVLNFGVSYLVSNSIGIHLLDAILYVGIATSTIFIYFSSSGGFTSTRVEAEIATSIEGSKSNYQMKHSPFSLKVNPFVFGCVLFFITGVIIAFLT
ncbi:hypothetical protein [Bacillus suaedaesalsae]|uniref:DUF3899 domain-containing protein n=1 Tax=Bacillus suaedaesalsae TaxID=2810349 RepID=A0ABS2DHC3_9BACI|nr:hypothetical protein [Bacillus suaedaesalsae]MBM6616961.1 hypothetical protein [Bacillus suaedaesalsae]